MLCFVINVKGCVSKQTNFGSNSSLTLEKLAKLNRLHDILENMNTSTQNKIWPRKNAWLFYSWLCVLHNNNDDFVSLLVKSCLRIITWPIPKAETALSYLLHHDHMVTLICLEMTFPGVRVLHSAISFAHSLST